MQGACVGPLRSGRAKGLCVVVGWVGREWVKSLKRTYAWDDDACFKAPRLKGDAATRGRKAGGEPEWVAEEAVLQQMHRRW